MKTKSHPVDPLLPALELAVYMSHLIAQRKEGMFGIMVAKDEDAVEWRKCKDKLLVQLHMLYNDYTITVTRRNRTNELP